MLIDRMKREHLNELFGKLKLLNKQGKDHNAKIEQILAYLEIIHSHVRKYSLKRELVFIDSCAGNCYLSFLVYYFYTEIEMRKVRIHCVDYNDSLMQKAERLANEFGFENMHFHTNDVLEFEAPTNINLVYSLHACDTATDATLYLGIKSRAKMILSVSCCQHTIKKQFRTSKSKGITKHSIFKDRLLYMIGDSMRSLLLELNGYTPGIFDFVSSRYTDKNIMLRAVPGKLTRSEDVLNDYKKMYDDYKVVPVLEHYLYKDRLRTKLESS